MKAKMMSKLIITRGIPASGKSVWADNYRRRAPIVEDVVIVNRDDLRLEMFGRKKSDKGKWKHEGEVVKERNRLTETALAEGKTVISSDTNFNSKHIVYFKQLAKQYGAEFEIKDFYIPVSEAEERDAKRIDGVGPKVIRRFWRENVCREYIPKLGLPNCIVVDLDGTIAETGGRRDIYQEQDVEQDDYVEIVGTTIQLLAKYYDAFIIVTSGRHDSCKEATKRWLKKHGFKFDEIYMRKSSVSGNEPPDWQVKGEIYDLIVDKYNIVAIFDDRQQICDLARERGYKVFQVADGRF